MKTLKDTRISRDSKESLINDISKIIKKHLNEGQVDGLRDVKIIRHYTTGEALKSILKTGIIEANVSHGDKDWEEYNLYDNCVISFHDVRTDPEYDEIIDQNNKSEWHGGTQTLGLHADKICCCIEIDYDKLDKLIQDKTHLLNIYGQKAIEFCNLWNYLVCFKQIQEEITGLNDTALEILNLYENNKIYKQLILDIFDKTCWDDVELYKDKKYTSFWKKIEEIFKRNFPNIKELYGEGGFYEVPGKNGKNNYYYNSFIFNTFKYIIRYIGWNKDNKDYLNNIKKQWQLRSEFYRRDLKKFTEEESKQLSEYAIKFDVISIIKMLKKHGWRFGDSLLDEFNTIDSWGDYSREQKISVLPGHNDNDYYDGSLIKWIDQLSKSKNRIIRANIEIRVGADIKLNKENCKIIIFDGICKATNQTYLLNLPKKYYQKYNIEHIK